MATNRSCAKSQEMRSKRKREITMDLNSRYRSTRHESRWKDGTQKHITCYSCGHQGHFSHECPQRNASLTGPLGNSDRTQKENLVSEEKSLAFSSYEQNVESRYVQDRINGIITCLVCGKEGHYTCDCPMKDQEDKVICTLCSKKGHCRLWCCQQNKSNNRACARCGEIGHSASTHGLDCSSCDKYHPHGECRMSKVTCLMCEARDHYLAQCPLNSVLNTVLQDQRENFRSALLLALSKQGSTSATPSETSKETELCEKLEAEKATSSVKCFSCGEEGHRSQDCPSKLKVPTPNEFNPLVTTHNTPARVFRRICLNCREEGHFAKHCPLKFRDALESSLSEESNTRAKEVTPSAKCFSCGEEGHWPQDCPSKLKVSTPNESNPLVTTDNTPARVFRRICLNCREEGHFAKHCPLKFRDALESSLSEESNTRAKKATSSVKCFSCNEEGHWPQDCPSKLKVPTPNKSNPLVTTDSTPARVFRRICLNCREEGHFAKHCPLKFRDASESSLSAESNTRVISADRSKELVEHGPSTAKHSSKINPTSSCECFNCGVEGHRVKNCPLKQQLLTPNKSGPLVKADNTRARVCYSCREEGHYANQCPQKRQKCQDYRTKSSR